MSANSAQLRTDHINLLIFRYLQESGFENAAHAFADDWHRPAEHRDPESLPFAPVVERSELSSVIAFGLTYDDLLARKCNKQRKFKWIGDDARDTIERRDAALENGAASRPPSSKGRKARPAVMRPPNEFPTPAPKRQRRSEGSEPHLNGDAMDVDAASASADADDDAEAVSPAAQSEPEPMEVVERYDSMDVATQTDAKTNPKTITISWTLGKPGTTTDSLWHPASDPKNARILLAVGKGLCRIYEVPESIDDIQRIEHIDFIPGIPSTATVSATAWRPDGCGAVYAINVASDAEDRAELVSDSQIVREIREDGSITAFQFGPSLLASTPVFTALHYSPSGEYFLVARTNPERGLLQVWKTPKLSDAERTPREPVAWRIFESQVLDVVWTEGDNFLVAGGSGLASAYQVDASHENAFGAVTAGTIAIQGLISHNSNIIDATYDWEKVRYDLRHRIMVFASTQIRKMILVPQPDASKGDSQANAEVDLTDELIALAFKPWKQPDDETAAAADRELPSLLAAGFADGSCVIYNVSKTSEGAAKCSELALLSVSDGPAATLAWSPSGEQLAIGNAESVQIWTTESLKRKNGVRHMPEAAVTWKPTSRPNDMDNEAQNEDEVESEPALSWSANGESLSFVANEQVTIIKFRPPFNTLTAPAEDVEMNGRLSPTSHSRKRKRSPSSIRDAAASQGPSAPKKPKRGRGRPPKSSRRAKSLRLETGSDRLERQPSNVHTSSISPLDLNSERHFRGPDRASEPRQPKSSTVNGIQ